MRHGLFAAAQEGAKAAGGENGKESDGVQAAEAFIAEAGGDDVLTGAQIESVISGRKEADCDEASGAMRIKRLRDALGNQMVSELLVRNITRRGYTLAVNKGAIRMI